MGLGLELGFRVGLVIIMRNTVFTATNACVVKWIRKKTTDTEVGSSNPYEYQQQKKGKGKSEITGGRLVKREIRGLGTTKDRRGMSEQERGGGW